ncbi:MAG: SAM-dependent methyltransferase [Chloroflexota bacterium]
MTSPTDLDPRWAESEPPLVAAIRDEILTAPDRRITFARFMERALTEPGLGYYATTATRPTREGDFLTAPELHPFFGRCLGRQLTEAWERLGRPAPFTVREWGAGRGTLGRTVADGLRADGSDLADALIWQPTDLPGRHPEPPTGPFTGAILANEYLDALPVHRVEQRDGRLLERYVTWTGVAYRAAGAATARHEDGWFAEIADEPSSAALEAELAVSGVRLADGQLAEIRPGLARWVGQATNDLTAGLLLVIDYGHEASVLYGPRRMAGTLVTYRGHVAGDDPFAAVGRQDITTHVDISAVERGARTAGLTDLGRTSQAEFLINLGLGDLLSRMGLDPATDGGAYLLARASVVRLIDPRALGGFKVMAFGRGIDRVPVLQGLATQAGR